MKELENIISELVSINRRLANNFKTEEGKELRADLFDITQKLEHYKQDQALQLQQTGVKRCFSDDHIGVIARNIAKEYAFENQYIYNQFEEAITKGMKIGRKVIQQNNA
jgi:hypothetical protein